jgi:mono/diheme cytochrome c family protein
MRTKQLFVSLVVLLATNLFLHASPIEEGKLLFTSRCAACHNVNKQLTGPALAGVNERRDIEWIIRFVQSSQSLVKSGDKDAVAVFQQFNKIPMPDHPDLTADNIKSIVEYIKSQAVTVDTKTPFAKPTKKMQGYLPLSIHEDYDLLIGYLFVVLLLILSLLFGVRAKSLQHHAEQEKPFAE